MCVWRLADDASEAAQQALADGELLPADVHEVEWDLVHQPALSRDPSDTRGDAVHIEAGASTTLPVRVTAKAGCTYAVISLEYAHLDRSKGATTKVHVRMLEGGVPPDRASGGGVSGPDDCAAAQR